MGLQSGIIGDDTFIQTILDCTNETYEHQNKDSKVTISDLMMSVQNMELSKRKLFLTVAQGT
jgi:hypothetical protein